MRQRLVVMGMDLSLTGSAAVVLPSSWQPTNPWAGVVAHRFTEEGRLAGQARPSAIVRGIWKMAVREGVSRAFVEEHSYSMGNQNSGKVFERVELVGAAEDMLYHSLEMGTVGVVASSARKLLFGPQPRMNSKEWKVFLEARFREMDAPAWDGDVRDAFVVANAGRYQLDLPCLASG